MCLYNSVGNPESIWLRLRGRPVRTVCMTWKRVATALVLIPVVVGLVLFTPTWVVAVATAMITVLALWEYFALGEAIGHRAYRVWTVVCSLFLVYERLLSSSFLGGIREFPGLFRWPLGVAPSLGWILLLFVLGLAVVTLWTSRPLVEVLPAA